MKPQVKEILDTLIKRYPELNGQRDAVSHAFQTIADAFAGGGKLLVCGNGGSAADSEHIVGELMKSFRQKRPLPAGTVSALSAYGEDGVALAGALESALPAISLCGHSALSTAFQNDAEPAMVFAQQVLGYGRRGDVLLTISTSGNSQNCIYAAETAKALGLHVIALTGARLSRLSDIADITVFAPETETYRIQEYHLPVYHTLCAMLEATFFGVSG